MFEVGHTYQFRPQLSRVVSMSEAAVFSQTPAVQLAAGGDGRAVRAAAGDVTDPFGLQCFNQPRLVAVPKKQNHTFL